MAPVKAGSEKRQALLDWMVFEFEFEFDVGSDFVMTASYLFYQLLM
jgi:hypothetical protein